MIETPRASKTAALNLGDALVSGFPRFYVDADVALPLASVRRIAARLVEGDALAASPVMDVDLRGSSLAVRAYYRIWMRLPYVREGMIGVGVYALSEEGRRRFEEFPEVIADDGYVRMLFSAERAHSCRRRAGARLRTRTDCPISSASRPGAASAGTSSGSASPTSSRASGRRSPTATPCGTIVVRPWLWPAAIVYAAVLVQTRQSRPQAARVHRRLRLGTRSVVTSTRPVLTPLGNRRSVR